MFVTGWSRVQNCSALTTVRTAAPRAQPELGPPVPSLAAHWHIDRIFYPLRGFSWVPTLRVVCKAMPLLWSATCSRRLPQDIHERESRLDCCPDPAMCTHTRTLTTATRCQVVNCLTYQHRQAYSHVACDRSNTFVTESILEPHTSCLIGRLCYQEQAIKGRLELSWLKRRLTVNSGHMQPQWF